jgi:hypothetical protein
MLSSTDSLDIIRTFVPKTSYGPAYLSSAQSSLALRGQPFGDAEYRPYRDAADKALIKALGFEPIQVEDFVYRIFERSGAWSGPKACARAMMAQAQPFADDFYRLGLFRALIFNLSTSLGRQDCSVVVKDYTRPFPVAICSDDVCYIGRPARCGRHPTDDSRALWDLQRAPLSKTTTRLLRFQAGSSSTVTGQRCTSPTWT